MSLKKMIFFLMLIFSIAVTAEELRGTLHDYEVGNLLGTGRRGRVHAAMDELGNMYALKKLYSKKERMERGDSPKELKRIYDRAGMSVNGLRAYRNGKILKHPNICESYEIIFHEKRTWVVMEYVEGKTVANVQHRSLNKDAALVLGLQYLDALEYLTQQGFFHGDLYGHNFMISNDLQLKVIDLDAIKLLTGKDSNYHNRRLKEYFDKVHIILWEILNTGKFTDRELEMARDRFKALARHPRFEKSLEERASPFVKTLILDYFAGLRTILSGQDLPPDWSLPQRFYWH